MHKKTQGPSLSLEYVQGIQLKTEPRDTTDLTGIYVILYAEMQMYKACLSVCLK